MRMGGHFHGEALPIFASMSWTRTAPLLLCAMVALNACRKDELHEIFDESKVNPIVFNGIMMAAGSILMKEFNHRYKEARLRSVTNGGVIEPITTQKYIDVREAVGIFNQLCQKIGG